MPVMPVSSVDYSGGPVQAVQGPVALKWDPKNLEIRTTSVERTLEPLVIQVEWAETSGCNTRCLHLNTSYVFVILCMALHFLFCMIWFPWHWFFAILSLCPSWFFCRTCFPFLLFWNNWQYLLYSFGCGVQPTLTNNRKSDWRHIRNHDAKRQCQPREGSCCLKMGPQKLGNQD